MGLVKKAPPDDDVVTLLTRINGPEPAYEVQWSRSFIRIYASGKIRKLSQAKMPNRKGDVAVRNSGWRKMRPAPGETLEQFIERKLGEGYRREDANRN